MTPNAPSPLLLKVPQAFIAAAGSLILLMGLAAVAFAQQFGSVPDGFFTTKLIPFAFACSLLAGLATLPFSRLRWYAAAALGALIGALLAQTYFFAFGAGL